MNAVTVENISKNYRIYSKPSVRLKELIFRGRRFHQDFWALREVGFQVEQGATFGIVGENGSGKSTLLQIIAGTMTPTTGSVALSGRVAALLELGASYNVGGGNERTNLEMVDQVCACLEALLPAAANPAMRRREVATYADLKRRVPDRPGHDRRYAVDSGKIRGELGWAPRYALQEGLAQTVRWYAEHRDWCRKVQEDNYDRRRLGIADRTGS
jgi:energy-coupling factor transporter ATP-binding protein EcfA2